MVQNIGKDSGQNEGVFRCHSCLLCSLVAYHEQHPTPNTMESLYSTLEGLNLVLGQVLGSKTRGEQQQTQLIH